jgi:hypothetical protein
LIHWLASVEDEDVINKMNEIRKEIDAAWMKEAEARLEAVKNGKMETISMEDVFSSINS